MDGFGLFHMEGEAAAAGGQGIQVEVCNLSHSATIQSSSNMHRQHRRVSALLNVMFLALGSLLWARCEASPYKEGEYQHTPPTVFPYEPYTTGEAGNEPLYFLPPTYYAPGRSVQDFHRKPVGHYAHPYAYAYDYVPLPQQKNKVPPAPGAPEPYLTQPYDYTKDFLKSLESIKELKDQAVRAAMLALKELEPTQPGSVFGEHEVKVHMLPPICSVRGLMGMLRFCMARTASC